MLTDALIAEQRWPEAIRQAWLCQEAAASTLPAEHPVHGVHRARTAKLAALGASSPAELQVAVAAHVSAIDALTVTHGADDGLVRQLKASLSQLSAELGMASAARQLQ